jgi:chemotaxis protein histidine kinase CheA
MISSIRKIFVNETSANLISVSEMLKKTTEIDLTPSVAEHIFLTMHSIKGSAPMFGFHHLPLVSFPIEKTFARIKEGQMDASPEIIEKTNHAVVLLLDALKRNSDDHIPELIEQSDILTFFRNIANNTL